MSHYCQSVDRRLHDTALPLTPVKDLPSMRRGSVEIRPERLPPPVHSSDIYYSLLTAPVYHNQRFSLQYLTWIQTVDPKQVRIDLTTKKFPHWCKLSHSCYPGLQKRFSWF